MANSAMELVLREEEERYRPSLEDKCRFLVEHGFPHVAHALANGEIELFSIQAHTPSARFPLAPHFRVIPA